VEKTEGEECGLFFLKKEGNNKISYRLRVSAGTRIIFSEPLFPHPLKKRRKRSKRSLNAIISAPDIFKQSLLFIHFEDLPCKNMMSLCDISFFSVCLKR
jgi:hypothetical protein